MKVNKIIVLTLALVLSFVNLIGCSQVKTSANQIAQLDRENIKVMIITQGNSAQKEIEDKELITTILNYLESITFSKMSIKQEGEEFGKGEIFNAESTYIIRLYKDQWSFPKVEMIVVSDKKIILTDSETIPDKRTVLYINQNDESSLSEIKKIYSIAKTAMD